jgi:hypothetical protein
LNVTKEAKVRRHSDTVVVKVNSQHRRDARGTVGNNCHLWTMDREKRKKKMITKTYLRDKVAVQEIE